MPDAEYEAIEGVTMVDGDAWRTAPTDVIVLGLKELPEDGFVFLMLLCFVFVVVFFSSLQRLNK